MNFFAVRYQALFSRALFHTQRPYGLVALEGTSCRYRPLRYSVSYSVPLALLLGAKTDPRGIAIAVGLSLSAKVGSRRGRSQVEQLRNPIISDFWLENIDDL